MQSILKKTVLMVLMAGLMPLQAHGFFKSAVGSGASWFKSIGNSALNATYTAAKKYTIPVLAGVGLMITGASILDYMNNNRELDLLNQLMADLEKQRQEKQLPRLHNETTQEILKIKCPKLKRVIKVYDDELATNDDRHSQIKVPHAHVIDYYENGLANREFERLDRVKKELLDKKGALLADPRLQMQAKIDNDSMRPISETLAEYLPRYDYIIKKHFDPGADCDDRIMTEAQAQNIINDLKTECNDCILHIATAPIYKKLTIEKTILAYLEELSAHAAQAKKNCVRMRETEKILKDQGLRVNPTFNIISLIEKYHAVRQHVVALIAARQAQCSKYIKMSWQVPATTAILAAIAAGSFALIKQIMRIK